MAGSKADPLTPEVAKARLRQAARGVGLSAWVRRRPYHALWVGVAAGVAAGLVPRLGHSTLRLMGALLLTSVEYDLLMARARQRIGQR